MIRRCSGSLVSSSSFLLIWISFAYARSTPATKKSSYGFGFLVLEMPTRAIVTARRVQCLASCVRMSISHKGAFGSAHIRQLALATGLTDQVLFRLALLIEFASMISSPATVLLMRSLRGRESMCSHARLLSDIRFRHQVQQAYGACTSLAPPWVPATGTKQTGIWMQIRHAMSRRRNRVVRTLAT